ncbi:MAG: hypothetical protein H6937_00250 [Burkholderiales bacterium]|nr:hypothetical protein [Burkholderiales bacterium]MDR4518443.1 hypothetical protein [Nitrosomonas sp.]
MKPTNKIILLGASNLTLSLRMIILLMQQHCGSPSEVLVAAGHGRSYGQTSQVLVRELPGIVQCGLWRQLQPGKTDPVYAFLTDIGNDILYGFTPDQILQWVSWCIQQLQDKNARIVMTNLPLISIESLPESRFRLLCRLLFPSCQLSRNEIIARVKIVYQGLSEFAARHQLILYEPEPEWMGMDGIHVSFWKRHNFYRHLFKNFAHSGVFNSNRFKPASMSDSGDAPSSFLYWQQRPQFAVRRIFGKVKYVPQPSGYIGNQATISLY